MASLQRFIRRLRNLVAPARAERELAREMHAHLALIADDLQQRGTAPVAAHLAARRAFGGVEQAKERQRDARSFPWLEDAKRDVRFAWRGLRRSPGFAVVAIVTIALGVGVTSALFTVVNAVLLRPLTVGHPNELVVFSYGSLAEKTDDFFPYPLYEQLRDNTQTLSGLAVTSNITTAYLRTNGSVAAADAVPVQTERVSGNYFEVLGVTPAIGRLLSPADDHAGHAAVVVISDGFWARQFGRDPAVAGKTLVLGDTLFTVIGVAPRSFSGLIIGEQPDLWWPITALEQIDPTNLILRADDTWWLRVFGRLRPGVSAAQATADANVTFERNKAVRKERVVADLGDRWTAEDRQRFASERLRLRDGRTGVTPLREQFGPQLFLLTAAAGIVLLIVCGNVANLLLARANVRTKEIAARLALGANRGRLIRQLLTEGLLLAGLGGVFGLLFARWGAGLLMAYLPQSGTALDLSADARVVAFSVAAAAITGLVFSLLPAIRSSRPSLSPDLTRHSRAHAGRFRLPLNKLLVITQVALTFFLLAGAALLVHSLLNLKSLDAGFNPVNLMTFQIDESPNRPERERVAAFERLRATLATLPGVRAATVSSKGLLARDGWAVPVIVPGYAPQNGESMRAFGQDAGPEYLTAMGIPLRSGRDFSPADMRSADSAPSVAIINETMARRFFAAGNAVGQSFHTSEPRAAMSPPILVVGVAADTKYRSLREQAAPGFIVPFARRGAGHLMTFELRTVGEQPGLPESIRAVVRDLDPRARILWFRTMEQTVDDSLKQEHFVARLAGFLGTLALVLAAVGLYGVLSYPVTQRARDLAIRMSLGATRRSIASMVFSENVRLILIGLAVGLPAAILAGRLVRSLLFGIGTTDALSLVAAGALLVATGALAGYLPARRAGRVSPMTLLRLD